MFDFVDVDVWCLVVLVGVDEVDYVGDFLVVYLLVEWWYGEV